MNLSQFFEYKIIPSLREVLGQDNVKASQVGVIQSICGHIIRPEGEADMTFRISEDQHGIELALGVNRADVMNVRAYIEDPSLIFDEIINFVKQWSGVNNFGRQGTRAEAWEKVHGTLTGVNPVEYNGLDEIENSDKFDDSGDEAVIRELE